MKSEKRSQRRTEAAIPLHVRGVDGRGEAFEEFTTALNVSRRGTSFHTRRELPLYTSLTIVIPGRGPIRPGEGTTDFFSEAAVVRVEREGELNRIGVRFVGTTLPTFVSEGS